MSPTAKVLAAVLAFSLVALLCLRYAPIGPETYREIAHHAVSVRKASSCAKEPRLLDNLKAEAAHRIIQWNQPGYEAYAGSGKSLFLLTLGKLKCPPNSPRYELETERAIQGLEHALRRGEDINAINGLGDPPLHTAIHAGNDEIVEFLLERGADALATNAENQTPLDVLESLVDAQIEIDVRRIRSLLEAQT